MNPTDPTEAQVRELLALEAKATVAPWRADVTPNGPCGQVCRNEAVVFDLDNGGCKLIARRGEQAGSRWTNDASAIVAARNLARPLAESWLRLREENGELHDDVMARLCHVGALEKDIDRLRSRIAELETMLAAKEKLPFRGLFSSPDGFDDLDHR